MTPTITPEAPTLSDIIASMRNYAGVAEDCEVTQGHAPVAIRNWIEMLEALSELQAAPAAAGVPDGVWEALQRLIENAATLGPASQEDAILVARYRRHVVAAQPQAEQQGVPELFVQWLEREMPAGTIIGKPAWWAPKLARALRSADRGVLGGCNG